MRKLIDIIGDSKIKVIEGDTDISINGIKIDSREVEAQDMYVAIAGTVADGHDYIPAAISSGATAVLCEHMPANLESHVTYIEVVDTRLAVGAMARNYYSNASDEVTLVGVTGTNGKTTVTTLLYQLFTDLGYKVGLISTVENKIGDVTVAATHTTPDVVSVHRLLRRMADAGCQFAFMEVSSHAVDQRRIQGVQFAGGVFTNMSHDHLDYHKTFANYIAAKKQFFDELPAEAFALTNIDDKRGEVMLQNTNARRLQYSLRRMADYKGKLESDTIHGLSMHINDVHAHFRMVGTFNAYNLLAVYGVAIELGKSSEKVLTVLSNLAGAEGRFEKVTGNSRRVGIVDYAHTPDALQNVLETIVAVKEPDSKIVTVVGCGGDRDKTKRPVMAAVAVKLSSTVIMTSDNPRSENPETILDEMEAGVTAAAQAAVLRITNRKEAIEHAVKLAHDGDIILIAGKGHEKYQDINGVKHPFDDKEVLQAAMQAVS